MNSIPRTLRSSLLMLAHLSIWGCALLSAYAIRFDFNIIDISYDLRGPETFFFFFSFRIASYLYWKLNEVSWRHVSTHDLTRIINAHTSATIALAAFFFLSDIPNFPRSIILLELVLSILGCAGARLAVRLFFESWESRAQEGSKSISREVLIVGAGESGHLIVKTLLARRQLSYQPMGILDDNPNLRGRSIYGVDVIGRLADLKELLEANPRISAVILSIPSLSKARIAEVEAACQSVNIPLKRIQSFEDIALTDINSQSRSVASVESVLERDDSIAHDREIREFISGKDIAVTGAGGSIGSELVRQLIGFQPRSLTLIDSNEFHMFKIQRELNGLQPNIPTHYCVASVVDEARIGAIFSQYKPKILFHAAAFKHVPLMEENPYEAIQNNVIGTRNLLRSCIVGGIEHFTFISTDKAVNSCSVMGHSKRIGELLVQEYTRQAARREKPFKSAIVRFGNVINSNGSVVPLFKEQILSGGPVTVTHPDMKRFFMSIREAVRLVLAAGSIGKDGEVFLLDMGKPVRIEDVARKMLALYGRRDIEIVYSGIRPGERLFEELTGPNEKTFSTSLEKVSRVVGHAMSDTDILGWVTDIETRLAILTPEQMRSALRIFVENTGDAPLSAAS